MKKRFLIALLCCAVLTSESQEPYRLDAKTEGILLGSAVLFSGITLILNQQIEPLTVEQIENLDKEDICRLDRGATRYWSGDAYRRSNVGEGIPIGFASASVLVIPALTDHPVGYGRELLTLMVMLAETNLLASSMTHMVKNSSLRIRPYVYNPDISMDLKQKTGARKSFTSGHVTTSAANSFFFARVFSDYFPESKFKPLVWSLAAAFPAWTGVERYLAGRHFPTDIIGGYATGALCGILIPQLHQKKLPANLSFYPVSGPRHSGVGMTLTF